MTNQRTLTAALLAVPAILAAIGVLAVGAWRIARPASPLFSPPPAPSLASATEWGELPQVVRHLQAREDPWAPFDVRHPVLTGDRTVRVSPLVWAVAVGNADAVRLLVGLGAPVDRPLDRQSACLATALGHPEIAEVLRTYAVPPGVACVDLDAGGPPLVALAASSE